MSIDDLTHLTPWAAKIALLPNPDRVQRIRTDRWVGYTKAEEALLKLNTLITHPKRQRMPNLLIIGPTNNGKTMIIEKFRRSHPISENPKKYLSNEYPVIVMQMPSDPKIARFYSILLYQLGIPTRSRQRISDLEILSLYALQRSKVKILIIDEVHNLLAGTSAAQREFLNLIRFLGNQLQIPIVCVGTKEAYFAIRSDDQLENRFEPVTLPLWKDDAEFASLLASLAATLPLRKPSILTSAEVMHFILDKSEGTIGEIITLITKAAIIAIQSGEETISKTVLSRVDYLSPTKRKHVFERQLVK
jgi:hypothetical protein